MLGNGGYSREIGDGKRVQEAIGLSGQAAVGVLAATAVPAATPAAVVAEGTVVAGTAGDSRAGLSSSRQE